MNRFKEFIKFNTTYNKYYYYLNKVIYVLCIGLLIFSIGKIIYDNTNVSCKYDIKVNINNEEIINKSNK